MTLEEKYQKLLEFTKKASQTSFDFSYDFPEIFDIHIEKAKEVLEEIGELD